MLQLITNNKFRAYDPLLADAYVTRLAITSRIRGVRAAEKIFSNKNVLLVNKGDLITLEHISTILQSKLQKPIEASIYVERELHADELEKNFIDILHYDDFLSSLNEHQDILSLLKNYIHHYQQYPLLRQKISVMACTMPDFYQRTIYCTWFSLLIAKEMHLSEADMTDIFLAAIGHDIGMLHINDSVLLRRNELSPDDWRHIQGHVYVSKKLLETIPDMPIAVMKAVFEHHERCDGTGYPSGKVESELSLAGKIIGLADSIIAIYLNRFKPQNRSWRDVIPVIQMNAQEYFYRHEEILSIIWRRGEMPLKNVIHDDELPNFVAELVQKNNQLKNWFEILRDALLSIGFTHGDRELHALQNVAIHLATATKGSGVFTDEHISWLRNSTNHSDEYYRGVSEAHVLQEETVFHLQRLSRMAQLYLESDAVKKPSIQTALKNALDKAKAFMIHTSEI